MTQVVKSLPAVQGTGFSPRIGTIPWRREWLPTLVLSPGEFHRQCDYTAWEVSTLSARLVISRSVHLTFIKKTLLTLEQSICPIKHETDVYNFLCSLFRKPEKIKIQRNDKGNTTYLIGCWLVINQTAVSPTLLRTWLKLQNVILLVLIPPRPPSRGCYSAQGNEKCYKNSELLSEWGNNSMWEFNPWWMYTLYQFEMLCHVDVRLSQFSSWDRPLYSSIQGLTSGDHNSPCSSYF